jgi:hypothetical protein
MVLLEELGQLKNPVTLINLLLVVVGHAVA